MRVSPSSLTMVRLTLFVVLLCSSVGRAGPLGKRIVVSDLHQSALGADGGTIVLQPTWDTPLADLLVDNFTAPLGLTVSIRCDILHGPNWLRVRVAVRNSRFGGHGLSVVADGTCAVVDVAIEQINVVEAHGTLTVSLPASHGDCTSDASQAASLVLLRDLTSPHVAVDAGCQSVSAAGVALKPRKAHGETEVSAGALFLRSASGNASLVNVTTGGELNVSSRISSGVTHAVVNVTAGQHSCVSGASMVATSSPAANGSTLPGLLHVRGAAGASLANTSLMFIGEGHHAGLPLCSMQSNHRIRIDALSVTRHSALGEFKSSWLTPAVTDMRAPSVDVDGLFINSTGVVPEQALLRVVGHEVEIKHAALHATFMRQNGCALNDSRDRLWAAMDAVAQGVQQPSASSLSTSWVRMQGASLSVTQVGASTPTGLTRLSGFASATVADCSVAKLAVADDHGALWGVWVDSAPHSQRAVVSVVRFQLGNPGFSTHARWASIAIVAPEDVAESSSDVGSGNVTVQVANSTVSSMHREASSEVQLSMVRVWNASVVGREALYRLRIDVQHTHFDDAGNATAQRWLVAPNWETFTWAPAFTDTAMFVLLRCNTANNASLVSIGDSADFTDGLVLFSPCRLCSAMFDCGPNALANPSFDPATGSCACGCSASPDERSPSVPLSLQCTANQTTRGSVFDDVGDGSCFGLANEDVGPVPWPPDARWTATATAAMDRTRSRTADASDTRSLSPHLSSTASYARSRSVSGKSPSATRSRGSGSRTRFMSRSKAVSTSVSRSRPTRSASLSHATLSASLSHGPTRSHTLMASLSSTHGSMTRLATPSPRPSRSASLTRSLSPAATASRGELSRSVSRTGSSTLGLPLPVVQLLSIATPCECAIGVLAALRGGLPAAASPRVAFTACASDPTTPPAPTTTTMPAVTAPSPSPTSTSGNVTVAPTVAPTLPTAVMRVALSVVVSDADADSALSGLTGICNDSTQLLGAAEVGGDPGPSSQDDAVLIYALAAALALLAVIGVTVCVVAAVRGHAGRRRRMAALHDAREGGGEPSEEPLFVNRSGSLAFAAGADDAADTIELRTPRRPTLPLSEQADDDLDLPPALAHVAASTTRLSVLPDGRKRVDSLGPTALGELGRAGPRRFTRVELDAL